MNQQEVIKFTPRDLASESINFLFSKWDLAGAVEIVISGLRYNQAKDTADPVQIEEAYRGLHYELKMFKKNFLDRGKPHW